jgi:hypothetical protein
MRVKKRTFGAKDRIESVTGEPRVVNVENIEIGVCHEEENDGDEVKLRTLTAHGVLVWEEELELKYTTLVCRL